jgi:uridine kinase
MNLAWSKESDKALSRNITYSLIAVKVILMALFSSDYQDRLFLPFIQHFLSGDLNPWQYFYENPSSVEFPYHPVMLYVLSLFYAPIYFLFGENIILENLFFKLPVLVADLIILRLLVRTFSSAQKQVILFYFASPIIIYASYIHSQLDLIPTAFLFLCIFYLIKNRIFKSALFLGLAISTKLHVLAAIPLLMIYLLRKDRYKEMFYLGGIAAAMYFFFLLPFINSEGFFYLVYKNTKQKSLFDSSLILSNIKIILPLLAAVLIYTRFLIYKKLNNDLLYTFLVILFSLFVILVPPSPAWYIWLFPFLSIFFIRNHAENNKIIYLYIFLNLFYIIFFVFLYVPDFQDISFLRTPLDIKIFHPDLSGIFFTALAGTLLSCIYAFYIFGVRSNSIYKKENSMLIGVGGDSGSGKSTLLSDLRLILGNRMTEIEGDGDHKWERNNSNWEQITHLNPKANFLHKQSEDLLALKKGKSVYRSEYDHSTGSFTSPRLVKPKDYITVCGLHPFYLPVMRKIIDLKIFVDTDERLRLHWKILRDIEKRGYSKEKIIEQIEKRGTDSVKYIAPQKNFADIVVNYYSDSQFEIGNEKLDPEIRLKVTLSADIHPEPLLQKLIEYGIEVNWDYSEDLNTQYFILYKPQQPGLVKNIADELIVNMEELVGQELQWLDGYRGMVQLIILYCLSERLRTINAEKIKDN